jgi:hypothetical protein
MLMTIGDIILPGDKSLEKYNIINKNFNEEDDELEIEDTFTEYVNVFKNKRDIKK